MTTTDDVTGSLSGEHHERLTENLSKVEELSKRLIDAYVRQGLPTIGAECAESGYLCQGGDGLLGRSCPESCQDSRTPDRILGQIGDAFCRSPAGSGPGQVAGPRRSGPKDRRFANPLWDTHPYFNFVKQQYLLNSEAIEQAVDAVDDLDAKEKTAPCLFLAADHRHDGADQFPGHQSRCAGKGGGDRRGSPGQGAGEPGRGSGGQQRRTGRAAGGREGVRTRRQHRHDTGRGGLSQPDDGADPVQPDHR